MVNQDFVIKYTAMPIYNNSNLEGYVVIRAYLVGEHKIYISKDDIYHYYEVVFTKKDYNLISGNDSLEYPWYDYQSKGYSNAVKVEYVFDTFTEAQNYVNILNKKLRDDALAICIYNSGDYLNTQISLEKRFQYFDNLGKKENALIRKLDK